MIFKNDFGFSTAISNKNADGTYKNMYISVQFPKNDMDAERISNKTKINILNGFLSFYENTAGVPKVKLIVMSYEIKDENRPARKDDDPFESADITASMDDIDDDDLPF